VPLAAFAGVTALLGLVGGAVLARTLEPRSSDTTEAVADPLPTSTPVSATVG
jgi:hypothetical protein